MKARPWCMLVGLGGLLAGGIGVAPAGAIAVESEGDSLAARSAPSVSAEVIQTTRNPSAGEPVEFQVRLRGRSGVKVPKASYGVTLGDWVISDFQHGSARTSGGEWRREDLLTLLTYAHGEVVVPSLVLPVIDSQGRHATVKTEPLHIKVSPPPEGIQQAKTLRDLKDPLGMFPWLETLLAAGILVLGAVAWWWWKKRHVQSPSISEPPVSPEESARQALTRLKERLLPEQGEWKVYYSELTGILRKYLEQRFDIPAMDLTTVELIRRLRHYKEFQSFYQDIKELFTRSDMVKFAKEKADIMISGRDWQEVSTWIERLAPKPKPEEVSGEMKT